MESPTRSGEIPFSQELWRKATHMGALSIPAGYYILGLSKGTMLTIMVPLTLAMILIDIARFRQWSLWEKFARRFLSAMVRPHEKQGDFTGATYILIAVCLTVALFTKPIAIAALAFIIVGDSFAAVLGRKFGRHRFGGRKTIEGSFGCLIGTVMVALAVPNLPLPIGLIGACAATLTEAFSLRIDDNLSVPLISGLTMTILQKVF
jgi:dolichol kinase